jgi:glucosamine-6-phosphate deaminase
MGIGTILQARRILLLASGRSKRTILDGALRGPVTSRNPASFLQLHPNVTLILDREASGHTS